MARHSPELRALGWLLYIASVVFVTSPLLETLASFYPFNFSDANWRVGASGLFSQSLTVPTLGMFGLLVAATILEHRAVQLGVTILSVLFAAVLLVLAISFTLDALQIQRTITAARRSGFILLVARGLFLVVYSTGALIVCAIMSWRARKATGGAGEPEQAGILVGRRPPAAAS